MILAVILLFVVFLGSRFALIYYKIPSVVANGLSGTLVLAFVIGSFARPFGLPGTEPVADLPAASAAPATDVPLAAYSPPRNVSSDCVAATPKIKKRFGFFDALTNVRESRALNTTGETVPINASLDAAGWGVDPVKKASPAAAACLVIDGKVSTKAKSLYGLARFDVGQAMNDPSLTPTGFDITIPAAMVGKGAHDIAVALRSSNGTYAILPQQIFRVVIR